jgi:hypothetical protein
MSSGSKRSTLPGQLICGEIRVKDAERFMGAVSP